MILNSQYSLYPFICVCLNGLSQYSLFRCVGELLICFLHFVKSSHYWMNAVVFGSLSKNQWKQKQSYSISKFTVHIIHNSHLKCDWSRAKRDKSVGDCQTCSICHLFDKNKHDPQSYAVQSNFWLTIIFDIWCAYIDYATQWIRKLKWYHEYNAIIKHILLNLSHRFEYHLYHPVMIII